MVLQAHLPRHGVQPHTHCPSSVSQQHPRSLQAKHPFMWAMRTNRSNTAIKEVHKEVSRHPCKSPATRQLPKQQADRRSTTYLRHRLGGGENDRDRDREDEDEDEDEDSLAPSELELKERLARLRPALQLRAEGLGESRCLR